MPFKDPLAVSNCLSLCLSRMQRSMSAKAKFVLMLLLLCCLPFSHENSFENSMYGNYTENYVLEGFQIETLLTGGIAACFQRCLRNFQCESVNYDNSKRPLGTCELNEKKPSELHQLIYRPGYIFLEAVIKKPHTSCGEILQKHPSQQSGSYWFQIGQVKIQVYCDMKNFILLGSIPKMPGKSCLQIKINQGEQAVSGIYWLNTTGFMYQVYCLMESDSHGWTLIARFSNSDAKNWMEDSGDWWYDKSVAVGDAFDPAKNTDMISPAFWLFSGNEIKITRSDDAQHSALLQTTGDCLGGQTFRSKITSYGNFRNGGHWEEDGCRGNCVVRYGGQYETTKGFKHSKCDGSLQGADKIGFWCEKSWDASVMMIGGLKGDGCGASDHGIGITAAKNASFAQLHRPESDFGDTVYSSGITRDYSLNLWIR